MKKVRLYLICRILFTSLFVIISTEIWFTRKIEIYHNIESSIKTNEIIISDLKKMRENDSKAYNLKIENTKDLEKDFKVYIIPNIMSESVSNNYIKYQINDNNIKTLNMDGIVLISKLQGYEEKDLNLKIWISDTYQGNLNYSGRIIVA